MITATIHVLVLAIAIITHALAGFATPLPSPTPSPGLDPCAHRHHLICGRIRLVSADPAQRRIEYAMFGAMIADALISAHGQRALGSETRITRTWRVQGETFSALGGRARMRASNAEATQVYRPLAGRNGEISFTGYMVGFLAWHAVAHGVLAEAQHFGVRSAPNLDALDLMSHLDGAASWGPAMRARVGDFDAIAICERNAQASMALPADKWTPVACSHSSQMIQLKRAR